MTWCTSCRGIMAGGHCQVLGRGFANMLGGVARRTLSTTSGVSAAKEGWLEVHGGYGSPYTRKVQAALRYKHLPFSNHQLMPGNLTGDWDEKGFSDIKPKVIPVVRYPGGDVQNDSTFILEALDRRFPDRPLLPSDPATGFFSLLLEDMFDEWGTKVMFGSRWQEQLDRDWSGRWLIYDFTMGNGMPLKQSAEMGRQFGARQVGRMVVVGCSNKELVRRSANDFLSALEDHLEPGNLCLLGPLPTPADFALYGQLSQLVVDRTPDTLLRDSFPACWAWIRRLEDLSGLEEGGEYSPTDFLDRMLKFAAEVYLPFLAANRAAIAGGEKEVVTTLWKGTSPLEHKQPVFRCYFQNIHLISFIFVPIFQNIRPQKLIWSSKI